jgi:hypothetical protein
LKRCGSGQQSDLSVRRGREPQYGPLVRSDVSVDGKLTIINAHLREVERG